MQFNLADMTRLEEAKGARILLISSIKESLYWANSSSNFCKNIYIYNDELNTQVQSKQ